MGTKSAGNLGPFIPPPGLRSSVPDFGLTDKDKELRRQVETLDLSGPGAVPESFGSGVVLDADHALVLTMAHVVRNATKIYVRLPGGRGRWADVHAADPRSDLAVLRLLDPPPGLKAIPRGDGAPPAQGPVRNLPGEPVRGRLPRRQPQRLLGHRQQPAPAGLRRDRRNRAAGRQADAAPVRDADPDRRAACPGVQRWRPAQPGRRADRPDDGEGGPGGQ